MKITCIGCTHGYFPDLDGGDLLIITGDLTARDTGSGRLMFLYWLSEQKYRKIIWIAGNHDNSLVDIKFTKSREDSAEYLCDSGTEFEGLKIWGLPWSLTFPNINPHCTAFTCTEAEMAEHVAKIPFDTDIIISHAPMYGIHDEISSHLKTKNKIYTGSTSLRNRVEEIMPKLFVCSHIHENGGQYLLLKGDGKNTHCINCSIMNEHYKPVNKPMSIELSM